MAGPSPRNANDFIEQQLGERARALMDSFGSDILALNGALVVGVDDLVRNVVEDLRQASTERNKLVVVLTTGGGYIEVVQRIVDTLRHHYDVVEFIVPNYAFSAGTVLAMSGDAIHMNYYSRLGPIDPQVRSVLAGFSPGQILAYSTAAITGALGISIPEFVDLWLGRRKARKNSFSLLLEAREKLGRRKR